MRKTRKPLTRLGLLALFLSGVTLSARALTINASYDASVTGLTNAAQVEAAFATAAQTLQSLYTNAITINITVYWGSTGPFAGGSIGLGINQTEFTGSPSFSYPQLTNALRAARTTAADSNSVASLPAGDPVGGSETWWIPRAEAKALGVLGVAANDPAADGEISFATNVTYTFDANNRAVSGKFDFIGVALHEMSEVVGRNTFGLDNTNYVPFDLFRFTNSGARSFNLNATNAYFSVDNGATKLKFFNLNGNGGDTQDWATSTPADTFDAFVSSGRAMVLSAADLTTIDVLGYKLNYLPPRLKGTRLANGSFQLTFTNTPGTTYTVLASTNLALAISNWFVLGTNTESTAGQFQFTDAQSATNKLRFYRVRLN